MTVRRTGVFPCRYDAKRGWWECSPHRATHWRAILRGKTLGRYPEKREAHFHLEKADRQRLRPQRSYRLGSRMGKYELTS